MSGTDKNDRAGNPPNFWADSDSYEEFAKSKANYSEDCGFLIFLKSYAATMPDIKPIAEDST